MALKLSLKQNPLGSSRPGGVFPPQAQSHVDNGALFAPERQLGAYVTSPTLHIAAPVSCKFAGLNKTHSVITDFHHKFFLRIPCLQSDLRGAAMLNGVTDRLLDDSQNLNNCVLLNERDGLDIEVYA